MRKSTTLAYYWSNLLCTVLSSANVTSNINTDTFNNFKQMLPGEVGDDQDHNRSDEICPRLQQCERCEKDNCEFILITVFESPHFRVVWEVRVACEDVFWIYFCLHSCLQFCGLPDSLHHSRSHNKKHQHPIPFKCCKNSQSTEQCISTALSSYWHDSYVFTETTVQNQVNILCKMSRCLHGQSTQTFFRLFSFLYCQRDHSCK